MTASGSANIGTVEVDGDFIGSITSNVGTIGMIQVGQDWGGQISSGGNIAQIQVTGVAGVAASGGSSVFAPGTIQTTNGASIDSLNVGDDFVGSINIGGNAPSIQIDGGFFSLDSSSNVVAGTLDVNGTATVIEIGTSSLLTPPGISAIADFSIASLNAVALSSIGFDGEFTSGSLSIANGLPATGVVSIGDSLDAAASVDLPANGLAGQVRINANGASGQFLGDVEVGGTTLNANYTTLSKDLGHGVAGAAPYNFHQFTGPLPSSRGDLDCNPFHTETLAMGECEDVKNLQEAVISHYGPVFVDGTAPQHYRIEFRPDYFPSSWSDVSHLFEVNTAAGKTATTEGSAKPEVFIKPTALNTTAFAASGWFRFRPILVEDEPVVLCAGVTGSTPGVEYDSSVVSGDLGATTGTQYDWYQFRVRLSLCRDDTLAFEGQQVNDVDLAAWIDSPFEVNMDGQVCSQDFADMSAAYNGQ